MDGFNQQVCFNELSSLDNSENDDVVSLFSNYAKTISELKAKGFNGVRYEDSICSLNKDGIRDIFDFGKNPNNKRFFEMILSTMRRPYLEPDSIEEERYINEDFQVKICNEWNVGQGFSSAYLLGTIVISLLTNQKWTEISYAIRNSKNEELKGEIINVFSPESTKTNDVLQFIEQHKPLILKECLTEPEQKSYKFRDDHGKDKLIFLWKRLCRCKYIISAINSLPFNSSGKEFIEQCFDDGKIYLRLVKTEKGYGMVIQTTGETRIETEAIGKIIKEKYQ